MQAACSGSEQWQPAEFEEFVKRLGTIETFAAEFNKNNSCHVSMQLNLANRAIEIDALNAEELEASRAAVDVLPLNCAVPCWFRRGRGCSAGDEGSASVGV